eukprot:13024401-Alexandrium_andersonii.AAC.1
MKSFADKKLQAQQKMKEEASEMDDALVALAEGSLTSAQESLLEASYGLSADELRSVRLS